MHIDSRDTGDTQFSLEPYARTYTSVRAYGPQQEIGHRHPLETTHH